MRAADAQPRLAAILAMVTPVVHGRALLPPAVNLRNRRRSLPRDEARDWPENGRDDGVAWQGEPLPLPPSTESCVADEAPTASPSNKDKKEHQAPKGATHTVAWTSDAGDAADVEVIS